MPSLPPPEPTVSCFDDLDFFNDFENEFPDIVCNDAQTSKSNLLIEPVLIPQHINEFDLNDETSLSEYDEEEQNVLYLNDLFPFNIIHPNDLKSEKDNDDNEIDIIQSSGGNEITQGPDTLFETSHDKINKTFRMGSFVMKLNVNIVIWNYYVNEMLFYIIMNLYVPFGILFDPKRYYKDGVDTRMLKRPRAIRQCLNFYNLCTILVDFTNMALPQRDQRHQYHRYEGLLYSNADIVDFETILARIYRREVHRVQVFDFGGLQDLMAEGLSVRMLMEHMDAKGVTLELHTGEEMESPGFARYWAETPSYTLIRDPILRLCHRLIACGIARRSYALEKVTVTDLFYLRRIDVGSVNVPYLLARYLRLFVAGRKSWSLISGGQFVARLAEHFGLLTEERLRGLTIIAPALPVIDMAELSDAATGVLGAAEDAPIVDEGDQAVPAPVQAPHQLPPPPPTTGRTMPQRLGRLEEEVQGLRQDVKTLRGLMERSMTDQRRFSTWMIPCMTQLMEASGQTFQAFNGTF
ncbi:hypothetical protein Tco_1277767 [Tanacetum coccineum]